MKFNISRFIFTLTIAISTFSFASAEASAQSEVGQSWFDGGSYNSQSEVDAMYISNAQRPLGGLFAPNFTRTLTLLGGVNFLTQETTDNFSPGAFSGPTIPGTSLLSIEPNTLPEVDKNGYALSFAFGRRHSHKLRSEIEIAVRGNDINQVYNFGQPVEDKKDGTITATSLMKNFILDFNNNSRFTPYVGAGLGISYINLEYGEASSVDGEPTESGGESLFSYQAIGGVATQLNSFADFIVEYRFLGTSEGDFDGLPRRDVSYNASSLFLGVKFEY